MTEYIIETSGLTKEFQGFAAVSNVDLKVRAGTIHALIGPNGAGKTTCFNLVTKFLEPTRGTIRYDGRDITSMPPAMVARNGMVRSFQISATFPKLTVHENVVIALQRPAKISFRFWENKKTLDVYSARADELLDQVGLTEYRDLTAAELSYGRKRALEIATTLALEPRMLLLDEPTSGLGHEDIDRIAALIKRVSKDRTVLMVEHNLSVVSQISDEVTVLARGEILAEGDYASVSSNLEVIEAYMGTGHA